MAAIHVAEHIKRKGLPPAACDIRFGSRSDRCLRGLGIQSLCLAEIVQRSPAGSKASRPWASRARSRSPTAAVIHDAGGSEVQELAFVLAAGVAYLRAMEDAGVALDDAQAHDLCAASRADADQFLTHRKIPRAAAVVGADRSSLAASRQNPCSLPPTPRGGC